MGNKYTPLLENVPRILVNTWQVLTPMEIDFWQRVRFELRSKNHELMMLGYFNPEEPIDVPYIRIHANLDAFRYYIDGETWSDWYQAGLEFDEEQILQQERLWHGVEQSENHKKDRRRAIHLYGDFYAAALTAAKPVLTLIWNGTHSQEKILIDLCRRCGCPVAYLERGPFAGTVFLDEEGILFGSSIARRASFQWRGEEEADHWSEVMNKLKKVYQDKKVTWWEQPESMGPEKAREHLKIPPGTKVLMFAGQIDEDAQNFLYSPHFENNLAAFKWFCENLPADKDIFILGKHHPKSELPIKDFQRVVAGRGVWTSDISLDDCLALSDRVAAVNSTVLYEALLIEKPVLTLGQSFLTDKNIAYEIKDLKSGKQVINQWLSADDFQDRYKRWLDFVAFLLSESLYSIRKKEETFGQNDSSTMVSRLIKRAENSTPPNYDVLTPSCFVPGFLFMELTNTAHRPIYMIFHYIARLISRFFARIRTKDFSGINVRNILSLENMKRRYLLANKKEQSTRY